VKREIGIRGEFQTVSLMRRGDAATLDVDARQHACVMHPVGAGQFQLAIGGKTHRVWVVTHRDAVWVHAFGRTFELEVLDPVERAARASGGGDSVIKAPMPGVVIAVLVAAGDLVKRGQALMVIESMKMQTELQATRDGEVDEVAVGVGSVFDRGARLVTLKMGN